MKEFKISGLFLFCLFLLAQVFWASDVDNKTQITAKRGSIYPEWNAYFEGNLKEEELREESQKKGFEVVSLEPIKLSGYTQVRFQALEDKNDTFDVRRARLTFKGNIIKQFHYKLQYEFGGTQHKLLDAELGFKFSHLLLLSAGQFKIPFSLENLTSSANLDFINRSQIVEALTARSKDIVGNQSGRDIGLKISGSFGKSAQNYLFDYALGVFNGSGINTPDRNEKKDIIGHLQFYPLKNMSIGASFYKGKFSSVDSPEQDDTRERTGAEFAYIHDTISFKSEYIRGKDGPIEKEGLYLQAGYFFIRKKFQMLLKYDTYDPYIGVSKNETDIFTVGINWFFNSQTKLQANYEIKDDKGKEKNNNSLIMQIQLGF